MQNYYLCIDLKSFYASVECVDRGLDSMKTKLVVADATRSKGTICLAVSPALKALGVKNRCRIYEIPEDIEYICAMPRMKRYMEMSCLIYQIYLRYVAEEDIHVYSIDECFLDITHYLKMYNKTPYELAKIITTDVYKTTGIVASAGIGTNLFLTKVALDITAKHSEDHIGFLDEEKFKRELWHHTPLTDFWNIGPGITRRLAKHGIYDLEGITKANEDELYKEFGINAELIIDHANGIEPTTIKDIKRYKSKSNSLSNSQILFKDYNYEDALTVMKEMVDLNCLQLIEKHLVTDSIGLGINYSKDVIRPSSGTRKIGEFTQSPRKLMNAFVKLYKEIVDPNVPIRRIGIGFGNVVDEHYQTYNLFTDETEEKKDRDLSKAILDIQNKFGKNAILKGISYKENATQRERNRFIGGHNSGESENETSR